VALAESLPVARRLGENGATSHADPHVWMDVSQWSATATAVAEALTLFDPAHAEDYRERATAWQAELAELHEYCRTSIASIPEPARVVVTSHDAFQYFGRAYGVEVQGIQGISTESEAGLQRINELVDTLVTRKVPAVFCESSVSEKSIAAVVEGAAARGHTVRLLGPLFSDAMGTEGTWEGTYLGMLDHNATLIARGLGGTAPAGGWRGKLAGATASGGE
jgi:manganese/zinc/iron transport system substrate-binding protein